MVLGSEESRPRTMTILGSTGSVGVNTVDLVDRQPDDFIVEALTAYRNVEALAEQSRRLRPKVAVVADPDRYRDLKDALQGSGVEAAAGPQAVVEAAMRPTDCLRKPPFIPRPWVAPKRLPHVYGWRKKNRRLEFTING